MVFTLRNRLKILIYVTAALVLVISTFDNGGAISFSLRRLSLLEAGLFVFVTVFDKWIWRMPIVLNLLRTGPLLRGTWRGKIRPTGGDSDTIPAYLSVTQTFSGMKLRLMTRESTSESTAVQLSIEEDGLGVVDYTYRNLPRDSVRSRSPIHHGAAHLKASGGCPTTIEGHYFTDRRTTGEMAFIARHPSIAHTYDDSARLFDQSPSGC